MNGPGIPGAVLQFLMQQQQQSRPGLLGGPGLTNALQNYPNTGQDPFTAAQTRGGPFPTAMPPMTATAPQQVMPPMVAQQPQAQRASFLARIFGGSNQVPGLLSHGEQRSAGYGGLLDAGLAMLANSSGTNGGPAPSVGQALAAGIQAGRESYSGAQQRAGQARLQESRAQVGQALAGADLPELQSILGQAYRAGDMEGAKLILDRIKAMKEQRLQFETSEGRTRVFDPNTGRLIGTYGGDVSGLTTQQQGALQGVYSRFHQDTQNLADAAQAYQGLDAALDRLGTSRRMDEASRSASGLAVIYGYAKLLDPGSVVREGELALQLHNGSAPERLQTMYNRLVSGEMAPAYLASIRQATEDLAQRHQRSYTDLEGQYRTQAEKLGISPESLAFPNPWVRRSMTQPRRAGDMEFR